ncbi:MAG: hypothetical protein ACR2GW_11010 [Pyrinomonadaceae bacterium]|nr:hypothetical protein [Acidobacteriota bacterium]
MFKKCLSLALITVMVCAFSGTTLASPPAATAAEKEAQQRKERLKTNLLKLVDDTRAERNAPLLAVPQTPPGKGNNLSTGAKVAIGVGIAVAVIVAIAVATKNDSPGRIGIF